jgi:hypothetical protein
MIPHTSYYQYLDDRDYLSAATETVGTEGQAAAGVTADTSKAPIGWLSKVLGFTLAFSRRRTRKAEKRITHRRRVAIVSPGGQDEWSIGDWELGDPRNTHGLLSGPYFQKPDAKGEPTPVCVLRRINLEHSAAVTVQTTASIWSLYVVKGSAAHPIADEKDINAQNILRRRGPLAHRNHERVLDELRTRIAGLALGTQFRNAQLGAGVVLPPGEFLIAEQSVVLPGKSQDV